MEKHTELNCNCFVPCYRQRLDTDVIPKDSGAQWVVKHREGYLVYTFGSGVYSVSSLSEATIFTQTLYEREELNVIGLALQKGLVESYWSTVSLHTTK